MSDHTKCLSVLKKRGLDVPETLIVLGSGWNKVLDEAKIQSEISYSELFGAAASVPGHEGKLVLAKIHKKKVAFMAGRLHMYEGYSAREATLPIRVLADAGVKNLVLTSAAGALNEKYAVGDFVVLSDLLTLFLSPDNPLMGADFVDMSSCFDEEMRRKALKICADAEIRAHEGVYVYYHGPNYETPADKMALRHLGADVVGMSTVPETIMARSLGMKVLGLSFVTNLAFVKHDHKEVVEEANKASGQMVRLLSGVIEQV